MLPCSQGDVAKEVFFLIGGEVSIRVAKNGHEREVGRISERAECTSFGSHTA